LDATTFSGKLARSTLHGSHKANILRSHFRRGISVPEMSDIRDLPLDAGVNFDEVEYVHIMRRIGIVEDEPGTSVSAFNSSI
jgi:hypothetical protein